MVHDPSSGIYNLAPPTLTNGQQFRLQLDSSGRLIVTTGGAAGAALITRDATTYETVAASATDQVMGGTGATGDYLKGLLISPATTSPGAVSIKDGAGSAITLFTGGAASVANLIPFFVPFGSPSLAGAWKVTTGANVSAIAIGIFT